MSLIGGGPAGDGRLVETVVRTREFAAGEAFDLWLEMQTRAQVPVRIRTDFADDFDMTIRKIRAGGLQAALLDYPFVERERTPKLIRRSDPEVYHLVLNVHGYAEIRQNGGRAVPAPGDLTLYDSSQPFQTYGGRRRSRGRGLTVYIPRAMLPLSYDELRPLFPIVLSGRQGIAALTATYLRQLFRQAGQFSPADTARLMTVTLDLSTALLAHVLDDERSVPADTAQRTLVARIYAFIDEHLGDPDLSPGTVAVAHNISVRSLHRLFEAEGTTVAAWIRARRLNRARQDLADPALCEQPIQAVAARWGFGNAASFSRAFTAAWAMSPRDYRRQHQPDPAES